MKFQYMNGLSYTHNNLLNALLECIKFYLYNYIYTLYFYCFIHLTYIQLIINSIFAFFVTGTGLAVYTYIFHMHFQRQKQLLINTLMNYIACQYNYSVL